LSRIETIGNAVLYLGDCRQVIPDLQDAIAGVLTDPPYGQKYVSGYATDMLWKAGKTITGDADCRARDEALAMIDCPALVFGTRKRPEPVGTKMVLTWDKGPALGMGDLSLPWKPSTEEIYVLGSGFVGGRNSGSVIYHPPVQSMAKNGRLHPNEKPVGLLERLLRWLPPGLICDPFMGSGSTGEAALKAGRSFVGIEIEPTYFEIACERLQAIARQPDMIGYEATVGDNG
jgi:DNA modification methylase